MHEFIFKGREEDDDNSPLNFEFPLESIFVDKNEALIEKDKNQDDPTNYKTINKQFFYNKENLEGEKDNKISEDGKTVEINNDKIMNSIVSKKGKELGNISINNSGIYSKEDIIEILDIEKLEKFKNLVEENDISTNILKSKHLEKKTRTKNGTNAIKVGLRRGRKKKDDNNDRHHNKFSTDNIIKKIKQKLLKYLVLSCKPYIGNKLNSLNYKIVNESGKKFNLKLLDMHLKDLLSQEISGKCTTKSVDMNKKYIKQIIERNNDETINYILNITFRDWIDIFTLKRKSTFNNVKFEGIDLLLKKTLEDKDNKDKNGKVDVKYFCHFIFCLYNYDKYWECKRQRKQNNISKNK